MKRPNIIKINLSLEEFICPITLEIPANPVSASCCGALFDSSGTGKLKEIETDKNGQTKKRCPCCREPTVFSQACVAIQRILRLVNSAIVIAGEDDNKRSLPVDFPMDFIHALINSNDKSRIVQHTIDAILAQHPNLCERMLFDLNAFIKIVLENKLDTLAGERFIAILKNNPAHRNQPAAIAVLARTAAGRLILRKNLNVKEFYDEKLLCFGNAVLSPESVRIQVDGVSVLELLSREIAADLNQAKLNEATSRQIIEAQSQELYERQLIEKESEKIFSIGLRAQFSRWQLQEEARKARLAIEVEACQDFKKLLPLARKQGLFRTTVTDEYQYSAHEAVNDILQQVVYGQRARVREMLEQLKRENPELLKTVLTSIATTPILDHSGKKIENMTLLQAAFAAGDVAIHADLARTDPGHQGMCEIIQSYFNDCPEDQADLSTQYAAVLKRSLQQNYPTTQITPAQENDPNILHEIHRRAQEQNTFDFSKIVAAITRVINTSPQQMIYALNKEGVSFTESDAARSKPNDQLTLTESFNRFREQYEKHALSKVAVNPYDLLKVFQIYETQFSGWTWDQRNLFMRQVMSFTQCYLSAADARVVAHGLFYVIEKKESVSDYFNLRCEIEYHLYPHPSNRSCWGVGFDYLVDSTGRRLTELGQPLTSCMLNWGKTYLEKKTAASQILCREREFTRTSAMSAPV